MYKAKTPKAFDVLIINIFIIKHARQKERVKRIQTGAQYTNDKAHIISY